MNLTETKNKVAQDLGYDDWKELVKDQSTFGEAWFDLIVTNVAELHAIEKVKEALKLAAERATVVDNSTYKNGGWIANWEVEPDSILDLFPELVETINKEA